MSNKSKVDANPNTRKVSGSTPRAGFADREALKVVREIIRGEQIEFAVIDANTMQPLGAFIDAVLSDPAQPETGVRATFEAINTELDKIWDTSERAEEIDGLVKLKNIVRRALSTDEAGGVQGSEWQPIETAPKDGTPIDLWRPIADWGKHQQRLTGRWVDCYGGQDVNAWVWPTNPVEDIQSDTWLESGDYYESNEFTHWMPLPTPPRDGGVQKETPLAMRGPSHD